MGETPVSFVAEFTVDVFTWLLYTVCALLTLQLLKQQIKLLGIIAGL